MSTVTEWSMCDRLRVRVWIFDQAHMQQMLLEGVCWRAWGLFCWLCAVVFLVNGSTRSTGIQPIDLIYAALPFVTGKLCLLALRFVVTGSILPVRETPRPAPTPFLVPKP